MLGTFVLGMADTLVAIDEGFTRAAWSRLSAAPVRALTFFGVIEQGAQQAVVEAVVEFEADMSQGVFDLFETDDAQVVFQLDALRIFEIDRLYAFNVA